MLDIARIESGGMRLSVEAVDPCGLIEDVCTLLQPSAEQAEVTLRCVLAVDGPVRVLADLQRMRQVLVNLVSNAIKYNRPRGAVEVALAVSELGIAEVTVTDTGFGIPEDQRCRIFEPFDRLGAEQTDVPGVGLGLTLSLELTRAMGGTLEVESTPGVGSVFTLSLPTTGAERPIGHPRAEASAGGALPPGRVLAIEDNPSNIDLLRSAFEDWPTLDLVVATRGSDGLRLAEGDPPDLLLLDLDLPDMGGADVLRRLREEPGTAAVPVVVTTADATRREQPELQRLGIERYLDKPLDLDALRVTIRDILTEGRT